FNFESLDETVASISRAFDAIGKKGESFVRSMTNGFLTLRNAFKGGELGTLLQTSIELGFKNAANFAVTEFSLLGTRIGSFLKIGILSQLESALSGGAALLSRLAGNLGTIFQPISTALTTTFNEGFTTAKETLSSAFNVLDEAATDFDAKLEKTWSAAGKGIRGLEPTFSELTTNFQSAMDGVLKAVASTFAANMLDAFANVAVLGSSLLVKAIETALEKLGGTKVGEFFGLDDFSARSFGQIQKDQATALGNALGVDNLRENALEGLDQTVNSIGSTLTFLADGLTEGAKVIDGKIDEIRSDTESRIAEIKGGIGVPQFETEAVGNQFVDLVDKYTPPPPPAPPEAIVPDMTRVDKAINFFGDRTQEAGLGLDNFASTIGDAETSIATVPGASFGLSLDPSTLRKNLDDPTLGKNFKSLATTADGVDTEFGDLATEADAAASSLSNLQEAAENSQGNIGGASPSPLNDENKTIRLAGLDESLERRLDRASKADLEKAGGRDALRDRLQGNSLAGASPLDYLRDERINDISQSDLLARRLGDTSLDYLRDKPITDISQSDLLSRTLGDSATGLTNAAKQVSRIPTDFSTADDGGDSNVAGPLSKMTTYLRKIEANTGATANNTATINATLDARLPQETL
ncbi:MAG: hypothetical protein AAF357_16815, partial [Verrucomicrobiota bacterium]